MSDRIVYACDDCGEEIMASEADVPCPLCGGEVIRVSPVLVALMDAIQAAIPDVPVYRGAARTEQ